MKVEPMLTITGVQEIGLQNTRLKTEGIGDSKKAWDNPKHRWDKQIYWRKCWKFKESVI